MRISDWSSDVCSSDLPGPLLGTEAGQRVVQEAYRATAPAPPPGVTVAGRGDTIPAFTVPGLDGTPVDVSVAWAGKPMRSEEHTSELQSLMRISYAVFCLKKKKTTHKTKHAPHPHQTYTAHKQLTNTHRQYD